MGNPQRSPSANCSGSFCTGGTLGPRAMLQSFTILSPRIWRALRFKTLCSKLYSINTRSRTDHIGLRPKPKVFRSCSRGKAPVPFNLISPTSNSAPGRPEHNSLNAKPYNPNLLIPEALYKSTKTYQHKPNPETFDLETRKIPEGHT